MITGIRLNGRGLVEETALTFFPESNQRISIVFGRNGSGKTTIGDGFSKYSAEEQIDEAEAPEDDLVATLLVQGSKAIAAPPQVELSTLVFNEQFIESNVRISDDGLRSLVLFGKSGATQDELDDASADLIAAQARTEELRDALSRALASTSVSAEAAIADLRQGWADRERLIRGNKNNSPVSQKTLEYFLSMELPEKDLSSLMLEFSETQGRLARSRGGAEISALTPSIDLDNLVLKFNPKLLEKVIEVPSGDGLVGLVAAALEDHGALVRTASEIFTDPQLDRCPLCLQAVSKDHRSELLSAIQEAVDKPAEDFSRELEESFLERIEISVDQQFNELGINTFDKVRLLTDQANAEIDRWNSAVNEKKFSLYAPVFFDPKKFRETLQELDETLANIEQQRLDWNAGLRSIKELAEQARTLNEELSRLEINARLDSYRESQTSAKLANVEFKAASQRLEGVRKRVKELKSAMKREDVAADDINRGLSTVFADSSRLKIVVADPGAGGGRFYLRSRGRNLKPHRLSVGERNVLSLCYFFTLLRQCINGGLDLNRAVIVLDDPISSVDIDCRIGILSYLESQLGEFLADFESAKVVLLTHDVGIFQDLGKTSAAILESLSRPLQGKWGLAPWVLRNTGTEDSVRVSLVAHSNGFEEPLHEYKALLNFVYQYGLDRASSRESDIEAIGIGNALRRVFEAFGVFIYGQRGITSPGVVKAYEALNRGPIALPIRQALITVLHGGSHHKDRMLMLGDFGMGASVDTQERVVVARRILALMHAVQPLHMQSYLPDGATQILQEWEKQYLTGS